MRDTGSSPEQHYGLQTTPKRALVLLCGQGVFLGFAISVFYTVSNTLFLTEHSSAFLPYVYIVTALFVSLVSFLFVSLQKKWSLGTFTAVTLASFTALIVISRIGMFFFDARWISFALMVLFTLFLQLSLIVLGSQAGQIFNVQQMKRLFPAVMAGQVFGVILGGAVVGTAAQLMGGTENLLILADGGMAAAWMLLVFTNHQFRSSLRRPAVHDSPRFGASPVLLLRPGAGMVRLALDMLKHGDVQLTPYLAELLDHHDPSVRREVYSRAERQHAVELLPLIAGKLDNEPDAEVKAAALRAFCALNPDGVDRVLPYLDMGSWAVKAGAMTGLLRYGGIYGAMNAGRRLQEWLDSCDPTRLLHAAKMVGEVAHGSFYQPLTLLFTHPAVEVRREALLATGAVGNRNLLPQMAAALKNREVRSAAIQALPRMGEGFLPLLQDALCDECRFKKETLLRIIRIAAQIRSSVLIPALKEHIRYPNLEIRHELLRSLSLCRYRAYAGEVSGVKEMIREELQTGIYLVAAEDAFGETEAAVLRSALHDEVKWARKRIFLLLSFLYDPATVAGIAERLEAGSEGEQSLALELLDFTVSRELKGPLLAFLDTRLPLEKRIKNLGLNNGSKETVLADLIAGRSVPRNDWTRACAVYIAGELDKGDKDMLTFEKVIALKSAEIFANTSDFALVSLASIADEIHVTARETFIRKDDMENCMYLVISGRVRVHDEGREIACLGDGEIIGEMSLLDPAPRSASVTAMEDTQGVLRVLCRRLRSKIGSNV